MILDRVKNGCLLERVAGCVFLVSGQDGRGMELSSWEAGLGLKANRYYLRSSGSISTVKFGRSGARGDSSTRGGSLNLMRWMRALLLQSFVACLQCVCVSNGAIPA